MFVMTTFAPGRGNRRPHQRGVVLVMALVVLVIMTLAGIALMRSVSTSGVIAGNLGFQQAATHSADVGVESAIAFLTTATPAQLQTTNRTGSATRYVAYREDPGATQSWDDFWTRTIVTGGAVNTLPRDAAGNTVAYAIHRLCAADGVPISGVDCSTAPPALSGNYNSRTPGIPLASPALVYYRITARVSGPRNSLSYVQVIYAL